MASQITGKMNCLFNRFFMLIAKLIKKLHITGPLWGWFPHKGPVIGPLWGESTSDRWTPPQRANYAEGVSMSPWPGRSGMYHLALGVGLTCRTFLSLHWRHNDHDSVSNHQPHGCLLNRLFRRRSKKTSKLRVTGLCVGNSPGPVNSPHRGPVTRKMFPFDDVIIIKTTTFTCKPNDVLVVEMMTSSNGSIFSVTGPLCVEFTGYRWIPLTKASDAELWCFLWSAPE